jgi:Tfp pilus assembly protein PilF
MAVVLAIFSTCIPSFAQTGGVTGKCTGEGGKPLAQYVVQVERTDIRWSSKVKTNKKGEYTYIGLAPGDYKVSLLGPDGKSIYYITKRVGIGDPTEINFDMAQVMQEQQKSQAANPEYQKQVAEQKQSASLKQMFDQGVTLCKQKQYTEAAAIFEKALPLAKDKNIPIIMGQLADTWAKAAGAENNPDTRKQDLDKALDYYQKVLQVDPNDAPLLNNLGKLYADMGKTAEAQEEFKKAADADPGHASSYYYNMGAILVNQNHTEEAAAAFKKATDLDPTNSAAWYQYGMTLMGKAEYKPDGTVVPAPGTIEAFQTYLKLAPNGDKAAEAQASLDALLGKTTLEYKGTRKK